MSNNETNYFNNEKPSGFTKIISSDGGNITKVNEGEEKLVSRYLESIYLEFNHELKFLPPIVLAKSEQSGYGYKFSFLGFFAVRSSKCENILDNFNISMKESWTGTDFTPEFLLDYDSGEPVMGEPFFIFRVDFEIQFRVAPRSITTFVWDQDPEGSRGTETVVQSGTGG